MAKTAVNVQAEVKHLFLIRQRLRAAKRRGDNEAIAEDVEELDLMVRMSPSAVVRARCERTRLWYAGFHARFAEVLTRTAGS